jgi:hypothetical protein
VVPAPWFIRSPPLPPGYRCEPADIAGVTWLNYSLLRRSGSAPGEMISTRSCLIERNVIFASFCRPTQELLTLASGSRPHLLLAKIANAPAEYHSDRLLLT